MKVAPFTDIIHSDSLEHSHTVIARCWLNSNYSCSK
jgi:hypothetical protein